MTQRFDAVRGWLVRPTGSLEPWPELPEVTVAAFSDDLEPAPGVVLPIRVCILPGSQTRYVVELSDTPSDERAVDFALDREHLGRAVATAFCHALGGNETDPRILEHVEIRIDPRCWLSGERLGAPGPVAMTMARIYDAVMGALAGVWPARVGAGSCSLGALVELGEGGEAFTEVVPGGEGATLERAGRHRWPSPIVGATTEIIAPSWLSVTAQQRVGSGGVGARNGGDGEVRTYRAQHGVPFCVGYDRIGNPPHGIDRAGPPMPTDVRVEGPQGPQTVRPWEEHRLEPGQTLVVETCGGAGHGFPGWGDIEWDGQW